MKKTPIISILGAVGLMASANAAMMITVNDANSFTLTITGGATFDGSTGIGNGLRWGNVAGTTTSVGTVTDNFTPAPHISDYSAFTLTYTGTTVNSLSVYESTGFGDPSSVSGGSLTVTGVTAVDLTTMDFASFSGTSLTSGTGTGDTSISAVPEASTALMAVFGGLMLFSRRRRKA